MLKIKKSYSVSKLRKNILIMTKGDVEFFNAAGQPEDMFFHIFDSITKEIKDAVFWNVYVNDWPIAYIITSKGSLYANFYIDIPYRTKQTIEEILLFIKKKLGSEFYTGTKKTNTRFIRFAERNGWTVIRENEKEVLFKCKV